MEHLEKIFRALRISTLSEREKSIMRVRLLAYIQEHPAVAPINVRMYDMFLRLTASRTLSMHPALAACVLVLCLGIGTSFAAEGALPGEPLYSVKTRVNERVQGAIAISPAAKVDWSAERTNRRLEEAEELAATGKLTVFAQADIESGLNDAIKNFGDNVKLLSETKGEEIVADAQSNLEASLNAHETVLASLDYASSTAENTLSQVLTTLRSHADQVSQERFNSEVAIATKNDPRRQEVVKSKRKAAKKHLELAQVTNHDGDIASAASMNIITAEAQNDIQIGDDETKKGDWGKAFGAFQAAIRTIQETKNSTDARVRLKSKLGLHLHATSTEVTSTISTEIKTNDYLEYESGHNGTNTEVNVKTTTSSTSTLK